MRITWTLNFKSKHLVKEEIERTYILNNLDDIVNEEVPAWLVVTVDIQKEIRNNIVLFVIFPNWSSAFCACSNGSG